MSACHDARRRCANPRLACGAGALIALASVLAGCSINYQRHHATDVLRLSHNADHPPHGLDPAWAETVLETFIAEFGVDARAVTPVDVYIDCDAESTQPSRFNRFTKSIVLRVGQAELPRLFVHELTHLFLDSVNGAPPYWADQGLAEYMESRCGGGQPGLDRLLPPVLELPTSELERIRAARPGDVPRHLSRDAIDGGWSWAVPFVYYLMEYRWAEQPPAQRYRILATLDDDDITALGEEFVRFYRSFDREADFLRVYGGADGAERLRLLPTVHRRFDDGGRAVFHALMQREHSPALLKVVASGAMIVSAPEDIGETFESVARLLHPDPVPSLNDVRAEALAEHLLDRLRISPADWRFPMVAPFLATRHTLRTPLSLGRVIPWLERWPRAMLPFLERDDVRAYCLERLDELPDSLRRAVIERTRAVETAVEIPEL